MTTWRIFSGASSEWLPNHAFGLGDRVVCRPAYATTGARAFVFECTTAGTSHASTEPTWPSVVGNTVDDNGLIWTCRSPGDGDWLNASCYLLYIMRYAWANGDTCLIHKTHAESKAWSPAIPFRGSTSATVINRIFCVDKDASDALSAGAVVECLNTQTFEGWGYSYGVTYKVSGGNYVIWFASTSYAAGWILEADGTIPALYNERYYIALGNGTPAYVKIINADIVLGTYLTPYTNGCYFHWKKGRLICVPTYVPVTLLSVHNNNNYPRVFRIEDVDFTDLGEYPAVHRYLIGLGDQALSEVLLTRCKLPVSSATFDIFNGTPGRLLKGNIRLHHCSAANKYYDFIERNAEGISEAETTVVRTGGASDGTTPQSWKLTSSAVVVDAMLPMESPPIHMWNDSEVEHTFTVEGILDSETALQNDELWLELEYPADNISGLGAVATAKCLPLGTPSDLAASTATWTTTGLTNPNKFKLSLTVTPGKIGPVTARVFLSKPSTVIYIDPMITRS